MCTQRTEEVVVSSVTDITVADMWSSVFYFKNIYLYLIEFPKLKLLKMKLHAQRVFY